MRSLSFSLAGSHSASWGLADLITIMQVQAEQTLLPWPMEPPAGTRRKRAVRTLWGAGPFSHHGPAGVHGAGAPPMANGSAAPEANSIELSGFGTLGKTVARAVWGTENIIMALQVQARQTCIQWPMELQPQRQTEWSCQGLGPWAPGARRLQGRPSLQRKHSSTCCSLWTWTPSTGVHSYCTSM